MSDDFSQLTLTIDTREKDDNRIKVISQFFEQHGAIVELKALPRCDYHISGLYRDVDVNLGIEHKTLLGDFFPSLAGDMSAKLIESYQYYDEVALFVEEGNYAIKFTDDGMDAYILNPGMQAASGLDGVGTLASYNNFCGQLAKTDIHVRSFRTVNHFPVTVSGLLKSIVKPVHTTPSFENPTENFDTYKGLKNIFIQCPGIGVKNAEKGARVIPNVKYLNSMQLCDFQILFGDSRGSKAYGFLNDDSRVKECALAWNELEAKNAPKRKEELNRQIKANKKSEVKGKVTPSKEEPLKSNPDKLFYSGELTYLNDNKPIFKEIDVTKLQSLSDITQIKAIPTSSLPIRTDIITHDIKESDLAPRIKDVVEFIRKKPRTLEEVRDYFDFTTEYCFKTLMEFKLAKKIWFENSTKTWQYGLDRNPMPIVAKPEMDIGV